MIRQTQLALSDPAEWLGDWHPLAEQLGSADGLFELGSVTAWLRLRPVQSLPALRRFLQQYHREILFPVELPAIQAAHGHASRNELRELVAFDLHLAGEPLIGEFASPSRRVGQAQLRKLRPLRDQRFVQRYRRAVLCGEAHGWHTLVYGMTLSLYSLPLRQGLLGYAHQTTRGFIYAAARGLRLSERNCRALFDELSSGFPARIETIVASPALGPLPSTRK